MACSQGLRSLPDFYTWIKISTSPAHFHLSILGFKRNWGGTSADRSPAIEPVKLTFPPFALALFGPATLDQERTVRRESAVSGKD